jgi:hypothetical protein
MTTALGGLGHTQEAAVDRLDGLTVGPVIRDCALRSVDIVRIIRYKRSAAQTEPGCVGACMP